LGDTIEDTNEILVCLVPFEFGEDYSELHGTRLTLCPTPLSAFKLIRKMCNVQLDFFSFVETLLVKGTELAIVV
jgi:hypothetical protein